jgi:hypothetical protein
MNTPTDQIQPADVNQARVENWEKHVQPKLVAWRKTKLHAISHRRAGIFTRLAHLEEQLTAMRQHHTAAVQAEYQHCLSHPDEVALRTAAYAASDEHYREFNAPSNPAA